MKPARLLLFDCQQIQPIASRMTADFEEPTNNLTAVNFGSLAK